MTAPILVSAYPISPAHPRWDPRLEAELLPAICALPGVSGLEVPWTGSIHPHDDDWFLAHVPAVPLAMTAIPHVMGRVGDAAGYGIASSDEEGRQAALADLRAMAESVGRIDRGSAASVAVVMLHTAPQRTGDAAALLRSLDEVSRWDWRDARLVIEHCDAFVAGQSFAKGFLALEDETAAIERSGAPVGLWLNWGRSAIELRDADAVTAQIAQAAASGLLHGLAFSGAAATQSPSGAAWTDAHLPILSASPESLSLLDDAQVTEALAAAGGVPWLGLKAARRPAAATAAEALSFVARNVDVIRAAG